MCITRVKWNTVSIILKMLIFHSFKASGSTFSRLHQRLLKSFKERAISLRHLGKSILEWNLYLGPLEITLRTLASGITFRLPVITCTAGDIKIRILTITGVRSIVIYINISCNFIKVEYSGPNWFVLFIANDRSFRIIKVIWNRWNH